MGFVTPSPRFDAEWSLHSNMPLSHSGLLHYSCKVACLRRHRWFESNKGLNFSKLIEKWQSGEVEVLEMKKYIRRYLFEKYDNKCTKCGWVEHIDGDSTNNKEENLTLLCPNCHSLTKTQTEDIKEEKDMPKVNLISRLVSLTNSLCSSRSMSRSPSCHDGGCGFESRLLH